jgi:hypothetical protein
MPGPARNSFMRHWWAVEVRISFLAGSAADSLSSPNSQGHPDVSTVVVYPSHFQNLTCFVHSYVVVGAVVVGGTWYLTRLARGPQ